MTTRIILSALFAGAAPSAAFAHAGHIGELAGHAHWVGVAALAGAALVAGIAAWAGRSGENADTEGDHADAEPADAAETAAS